MKITKTGEPEARAAGIKVGSVDELVEKLKKWSSIMTVLILAELNGNDLSEDATAKAISAAKMLGDVYVLCATS